MLISKKIVKSSKPLRNSHDQFETLWVKIAGWTNEGDLVVGICYRLPDSGEPVDEVSLLQLQEAS